MLTLHCRGNGNGESDDTPYGDAPDTPDEGVSDEDSYPVERR